MPSIVITHQKTMKIKKMNNKKDNHNVVFFRSTKVAMANPKNEIELKIRPSFLN